MLEAIFLICLAAKIFGFAFATTSYIALIAYYVGAVLAVYGGAFALWYGFVHKVTK